MSEFDLGDGYRARPTSYAAYREACQQLERQIFGDHWTYAFGSAAKTPPPLGETFTVGLFHEGELIGWSHSHQSDERTVYMADTGLLPEHQGQGLYKKLLPHLLDTFRAAGYTLVQSHHRATNNRVIIPKLRAGFHLQGLNLYEGGLNVALTYSLADHYREAQHIRSGFKQAAGEAARRLGVTAEGAADGTAVSVSVSMPSVSAEPVDLGDGYQLWRVPYDDYQAVYQQLEDAAYHTVSFDWGGPAALPAPDFRHYTWLISHGGEVAGWQHSRQWDSRTAYMVNTAFLPVYRGKGLYTRLLRPILSALQAEGYALIRSHHHATNNAVIIPKLRAGFRLQGLQVDSHGVMAILMYSFGDIYRDYMDVRSGLMRPGGEVGRRLGLRASPANESL